MGGSWWAQPRPGNHVLPLLPSVGASQYPLSWSGLATPESNASMCPGLRTPKHLNCPPSKTTVHPVPQVGKVSPARPGIRLRPRVLGALTLSGVRPNQPGERGTHRPGLPGSGGFWIYFL